MAGWFAQQEPKVLEYVNADGTVKDDVSMRQTSDATASSGGDYAKSNEEYEALLQKYQSGIDATNPDSIRQLAEAMQKDGIAAEVSKDGLLINVPGYDGGWVDPRQDKAYAEGRGGIRGWAFQPYYGSDDFKRLTAEGRNPHTGEQALPGQTFSRDQDAPISGPGAMSGGQFQNGTFTGGGQYPLASVMGVGLMQPWTTPFQAPNVTDDPGYKFRMDEAQNRLENSAATRGLVRTGGFIKDLNAQLQGMASQEYQNAYNRKMGEYQTAYGIFDRNQNNQFNRMYSLSGMGLNAAQSSAGQGPGYANAIANTVTGIGNANAAGRVGATNASNQAIGTAGDIGSLLAQYWATRRKQDDPMVMDDEPGAWGGSSSGYDAE